MQLVQKQNIGQIDVWTHLLLGGISKRQQEYKEHFNRPLGQQMYQLQSAGEFCSK